MYSVYGVAIVGSGPAGMSAATRAAKMGLSHILLERRPHLTDTVHSFHKRKHVMAAPDYLPLRSDLGFEAGAREEVLETWERDMEGAGVQIRHSAEVAAITGQRGAFEITLADGDCVVAESVVLSIGVQGNPRRLAIPGADLPFVQYQLDDPDEYRGESIIVVGAGDAAIETALALTPGNQVTLVNRSGDFPRAKPANVTRIRSAAQSGLVRLITHAKPRRVGLGHVVLDTAAGDARLDCDRIIARLGTESRPDWLERAGITFVSDHPDALPYLSESYESRVPGLYVVGAMAGFPLIKHCLQQGYEVVEHILGNAFEPLDEPVLRDKLAKAGVPISVDELVALVHRRMQLCAPLTPSQVRECLVQSEIRMVAAGEIVFRQDDYADSLFWLFVGEIALRIEGESPRELATIRSGQFFGEMELVSGRPRAATAVARSPSLLLEIERPLIQRLARTVPELKRSIDDTATIGHIKAFLAPDLADAELAELAGSATLVQFVPNQILVAEGADDCDLYLIRKGAVTVSRRIDGRDMVVDYLPAGNYVGVDAVLRHLPRATTIKAASPTEAIRIEGAAFRRILQRVPDLRRAIDDRLAARERDRALRRPDATARGFVEFLVREGAVEATNMLVIDQSLCVRCDNCEKACADTHQGVSRLDRDAGPTYDSVHLPVACRHCEHPSCMDDCATGSIRRTENGEVFIEDTCNGCGNCERNCPYGVIEMAAPQAPPKWGLLARLLFGLGGGDEDEAHGIKRAVKCDLCRGVSGGPACVSACPTGAAMRLKPEDLIATALRGAGA